MKFKNKILEGDCLEVLKKFPDESIDCVMTSPPYWALRDYGVEGQLGLEPTFQEYINKLCNIFDEVKRVLKKTGTCWVNMGDTYGGSNSLGWKQTISNNNQSNPKGKENEYLLKKHNIDNQKSMAKSLLQIPSRFAIEMTARGWILRNEIIWYKPSCMPSSIKDRFTVDFEKIFFFVKNKKYYFEQQLEPLKTPYEQLRKDKRGSRDKTEAAKVGAMNHGGEKTLGDTINPEGRNKRVVWRIAARPYPDAHFATYPEELCRTPIKAGCAEKGIVLDPFAGSGTTLLAAKELVRNYVGIELNPEYIKLAEKRLAQMSLFI